MEFLTLYITPTRVAVVTLSLVVAWAASSVSSFVRTFTRTQLRYIPGPKSESFIQGNLAKMFKADSSAHCVLVNPGPVTDYSSAQLFTGSIAGPTAPLSHIVVSLTVR